MSEEEFSVSIIESYKNKMAKWDLVCHKLDMVTYIPISIINETENVQLINIRFCDEKTNCWGTDEISINKTKLM